MNLKVVWEYIDAFQLHKLTHFKVTTTVSEKSISKEVTFRYKLHILLYVDVLEDKSVASMGLCNSKQDFKRILPMIPASVLCVTESWEEDTGNVDGSLAELTI